MSSPEYILKLEQIDASREASLKSIQPETLLKLRDDGYFISRINEHPFTFTISDSMIGMDESEGKRVYLSVRSEGPYKYQLSAFSWTPLQTNAGDQIPAISCDETQASCWGYQVSGPDTQKKQSDSKSLFHALPLQERKALAQNEKATGERASQIQFRIQKDPADHALFTGLIELLAIPVL